MNVMKQTIQLHGASASVYTEWEHSAYSAYVDDMGKQRIYGHGNTANMHIG